MSKKIGVIILNYISYKVTIKCVNYFLRQNQTGYEVQIIIVDNDSPNSSFKILQKRYKNHSSIHVVKTTSNLGFANGNNYGYKELLKYMNPDFVIMSNSDAFVKKDGLYKWIDMAYSRYSFGILGPSIYSLSQKFYQNPGENLSKEISILKKYKFDLEKGLINAYVKYLFHLPSKQGSIDKWDNPYYHDIHLDKTLHGAFEIFSKKYFNYYELPYDPRTFMYLEENILRIRCEQAKLPMVYLPTYTVYHLQAASTSEANSTLNRRKCFKLKNMIKSLNIYIKIIKKLQND